MYERKLRSSKDQTRDATSYVPREDDEEYDDIEAQQRSHHSSPTTVENLSPRMQPTANMTQVETEQQSDVPTFYPVEATLVKEHSSSEYICNAPVYDAVLIPDPSSIPLWKRRRIRTCILLIVAVTLAAAAGALSEYGSRDDSTEIHEKPLFLPPPFNCSALNLGTLYDTECDTCTHTVGVDSKTFAVVRAEENVTNFHFISSKDVSNISSQFASYHHATDNWVGSVAVCGDVVAAGNAYEDRDWIGAAYVFERDSKGTWNETTHIVPSNIEKGAEFGSSISIDGDLMVVGAPNDRDTIGSAFIYRRIQNTWVKEEKLEPDDPGIENFGYSVSVRDGLVAISDNFYGSDAEGAVLVYSSSDSS